MAQARKKTDTTFSFNIVRHIRYGMQESGFLLFAGLALYLFMALLSYYPGDPAWRQNDGTSEIHNLAGVTGAWFSDITLYFFGYFAYLLPLGVVFAGWRIFKRGALVEMDAEIVVFRCLGFIVTLGAGCGLAYFYVDNGQVTAVGGGVLGQYVGDHLITAFGRFGAGLFLIALFMAGINLTTGVAWLTIIDAVGKITLEAASSLVRLLTLLRSWLRFIPWPAAKTSHRLLPKSGRRPFFMNSERPALLPAGVTDYAPQEKAALRTEPSIRLPEDEPAPMPIAADIAERESAGGLDEADELYAPAAEPLRVKAREAPGVRSLGPLPPLDLLDLAPSEQTGYSSEILDEMSRQVETLLRHFGIEVQVVAVEPGPVITRFELDPAPGVKVSQITNLAKDLARGLSVISVRVVEVIPGKSVIGLEIPNQHRDIVYLSEILDSSIYAKAMSPLTLGLGKDIGGRPVIANLAKMPHLLVAGTTGSGKSVAVNAMLLSILYKARSDEVRLIMVDPKMLELSVYEGIPHLLAPVVTDMKEAANALRWCVAEMDRRYRLMAALKVRNIAGFNRKVLDAIEAGEAIIDPLHKPEDSVDGQVAAPILEPLPFIVVVIDELADMMMIVGKKVEELIARLAQKARASGIHLILATQRPSVDVITGLIKANIPTRIAFQVSSKTDSRTILDQMGAEQLLGHGDMLYLPPGTGFPQRVHGAFVDDHEVHRVVEFLKSTGTPDYCDDILQEPVEGGESGAGADIGLPTGDGGGDPLYDQAVRIVTETRRASISGVQRRLKIGYNRAARLIEEMETAGIVGPLESNGSREVLAPPPPAD